MSSPAPSSSGERGKKPLEQITFRFCSECSNMLYPKEDEAERKLLFTCRTCSYSEEATSSCIFRNVLNNAAGETAGVTQDVGSDPTVSSAPLSSHDPSDSPLNIGPHFYVWCLCCGEPIVCGFCESEYAAIATDIHLRPDNADVVPWHMSVDSVSLFAEQIPDALGTWMEDEYDEEPMERVGAGDNIGGLTHQCTQLTTEPCSSL